MPDNEGGGLERSPDHLVGVPGYAVHLLTSSHEVLQLLGEHNRPSPTGVHMEPHVVSPDSKYSLEELKE